MKYLTVLKAPSSVQDYREHLRADRMDNSNGTSEVWYVEILANQRSGRNINKIL